MTRRRVGRPEYTQKDGFEAVAKSLREFGYPDATASMVADTWAAMKAGKQSSAMPHGIIGRFAERQLDEVRETFETLLTGDKP